MAHGFHANYGLITATADGLAYPQPKAGALPEGLPLLALLGLIFGKALYEGTLMDVSLAAFFIARLQGRRPLFDDLAGLDVELHRNLLHLKRQVHLVHQGCWQPQHLLSAEACALSCMSQASGCTMYTYVIGYVLMSTTLTPEAIFVIPCLGETRVCL